jgi:hypothetical protein
MYKKHGGRFIRNGNCFHRDQLGSPLVFVGGSVLLIVFVFCVDFFNSLEGDFFSNKIN